MFSDDVNLNGPPNPQCIRVRVRFTVSVTNLNGPPHPQCIWSLCGEDQQAIRVRIVTIRVRFRVRIRVD